MAKQAQDRHARNIGTPERIFSLAGGGWLALKGLRRRSLTGTLLAAAGATLLYRGSTGHSALYRRLHIDTLTDTREIRFSKAVTVNAPPGEVYGYWRDVENFPRFLSHIRKVRALSNTRSHWITETPTGRTGPQWDSEIIEDVPNQRIVWRSLEGGGLYNTGSVSFRPAPGHRGTEVLLELEYRPPRGTVTLSKLMVPLSERVLAEDLRRFKRMVELGKLPTTQGQPVGREQAAAGGAA
ncbi:SRPBCC family protein [Ectothiorhodospiraceae bacterium 2226]|nr:SRPBCC family protein [Ectothiorhodospiraceae bacterium 2226]